ncbi:MAG: polyphosphate kinase 1 [Candidatus Promineifilaceae bacterium]|nr:polyphosphate kinase 1 [Candidatus Promineifilaceae bacterium]
MSSVKEKTVQDAANNGSAPAGDNTTTIDLKSPSLYINRELSHIEFNRRVLEECLADHPLLERVKFLAIYSSNTDEFFMVRVSGLKQQMLLGITDAKADGLTPREQLVAIHRVLTQLFAQANSIWHDVLYPELVEVGINILSYSTLKKRSKQNLRGYFDREIFPVLTPLAFDPSRPWPHISNLSLNLAVVIKDPNKEKTSFARVKVPSVLPRLVPLEPIDPDELLTPTEQKFVWVEEVIAANLDRLFPGMEIIAAYPFRVTRNTDMEIQEEEADDLLLTMEENLRQRHFGSVVRLEIADDIPEDIRATIVNNLQLSNYDIYTTDGPLGLSSLWEVHKLDRPELKDKPYQARLPQGLGLDDNIFERLRQRDIFIHRPYDSFGPIVDFLNQAAEDPKVLAIKQTLYRVGPNPPIVRSLMRARENGKQVTVLVELKARFDEESNIEWARALDNAGVHVVYGLLGLKTHCKVSLVVRREREGIRLYLHLSSGNYNVITARLYTDMGLMSTNEAFGADATELFNYLTGYSNQRDYRKFLVAPVNLRQGMLDLIEREIEQGKKGYIFAKSNSLVDPEIIRAFYRASQAGVKVDLVIRGICCLRPGLPDISENIRVFSIIGRYLEHTRVYYFQNSGDPLIYIGSADLMPRNIDRRVEVLFPIENPTLKQKIYDNVLQIYLRDTAKAHVLQSNGEYIPRSTLIDDEEPLFNSQSWFMKNDIFGEKEL